MAEKNSSAASSAKASAAPAAKQAPKAEAKPAKEAKAPVPKEAAKAESPKVPEAGAEAKAVEKAEAAPKEAKKREIVLERVYSVPLMDAYKKPHDMRANYAVRSLRAFVSKHMKAELGKIKISSEVNEFIRENGSRKPAKLVKVRATKDKEGVVFAEFAE